MPTAERYIMRRYLVMFAASLGAALAIVWTTQALTRINVVTDAGQTMLTFVALASLLLPSMAALVAPFAVALAVSQTLTTMNNDSELVVLSASGAGARTVVRPALILGFVASLASFALDNGVNPITALKFRTMIAEANGDLLGSAIQEGTFKRIEKGLFVQVAQRLANGELAGIFVADSRTAGTDLAYYAKQGQIVKNGDDSVLVMNDGEVHRKAPDGEVSVIRFTSYAFALDSFGAAKGGLFLLPRDRPLSFVMDPDKNDAFYKSNPQYFGAELHRRLTEWVYPFVFALISLAVASSPVSHRQARLSPILTSLTLCIALRWAAYSAAGFAVRSSAGEPLLYAVPAAAAGVSAYVLMTNRSLNLPVSWANRISDVLVRLSEMSARLRFSPAAMARVFRGRP